ncbi:MAG: 3-hydroxyacyl-CoA dehydrogenase family protein [Bacteroidia bacterium]|nr:MAG: 3-hydroxyacyl-CoA dehydrogenase family protein [Bacteroidia bacterium]
MQYDERIRRTAVLGAAGKMGSGILLLAAAEMADISLKPENRDKVYELHAIDISPEGLKGLYTYLKNQLLRIAEKKAVLLREVYKDRVDLIENEDIIHRYVDDAMRLIHFSTRTESAYNAHVIFEAAVEEVNLKVDLLRQISDHSEHTPWFLTNTSSIPIAELNKRAGLEGNIIGFHFYNPPAVQRIVEFVAPEDTNPDLKSFSQELAKKMKKVIVPANDFAGFIGNGYLMRDILYGIGLVHELQGELGFAHAVYSVNRVSRDFLLRPMGIFQLMDYVGIDVCQKIMAVMSVRLNKPHLHSDLIDLLISMGVRGGQHPDGSQKAGILYYEKGRETAIFDPGRHEYVPVDDVRTKADAFLGPLPENHQPWKQVIRNRDRESWLNTYFAALQQMDTQGAILARNYLEKMKDIGLELVKDGIAQKPEDVNTVMITGFYHAYGLINDFINK